MDKSEFEATMRWQQRGKKQRKMMLTALADLYKIKDDYGKQATQEAHRGDVVPTEDTSGTR